MNIYPGYTVNKNEQIKCLEQRIEDLQKENAWLRKLLDDVTAMARSQEASR